MDPHRATLRLLRALEEAPEAGGVVLLHLTPAEASHLAASLLRGAGPDPRGVADHYRRLLALVRHLEDGGGP